jgi:hypothetical protein
MSISMSPFAAEGLFPTVDPYRHQTPPPPIFTLACQRCGHDDVADRDSTGQCPKCGGQLRRTAIPGALLHVQSGR